MTTATADMTVLDLFRQYDGRAMYIYKVSGNNGDDLILYGTEHLLAKAGAKMVDRPEDAEVILVNGGFKSDFWPFANDAIKEFSQQFPSTELVVLPSSFYFETFDFASLFAGRKAPVTIYARERRSLEIIQGYSYECEVRFGLDHDTAFALADAPMMTELRDRLKTDTLLIVERGDAESSTGLKEAGPMEGQGLRKIATTVLPRSVALKAARVLGKMKGDDGRTATPFAEMIMNQLYAQDPSLKSKPLDARDISRRSVVDFNAFGDAIANAAAVVSTRLHVGIMAAMLDKPTLVVGGTHHKIPGIYEYSMRDMPHVTLIDPEGRDIGRA